MPKPVFIGDTLRGETEVVDLKDGKSRPNAGIVTFRHRMMNQRDEIVCECLRTALVNKVRSEEHPSELQSLMRISYAVFCLQKKTNETSQLPGITPINVY